MNKEFLKKLLVAPSPSGYEKLGLEIWKNEFKDKLQIAYEDKSGNLGFKIGSGPTTILLSGHVDEICMAVNYIDDKGFIVPCNMNGVDKKVLPGSEVLILSDRNDEIIHGVVQKNPIHIEWPDEELRKKALDFSELRIDIGTDSKEETLELVQVGDIIIHGRQINLEFGNNKLHGNSLDDKAGVFVVSEILKNLIDLPGDWQDKYTVIGLACIGEESGLLGAHRAAHQINPDISIDFDVTFACDTGQYEKTEYGEIYLGKGPVIEYGQDKSRRLNKILKDFASEASIDVQNHSASNGGTNTEAFFLESNDAETTLISLPLISMHTPVETMNWKDIDGAIKIVSGVIKDCKL